MRMKPRPAKPYERRNKVAEPGVTIAANLREPGYGGGEWQMSPLGDLIDVKHGFAFQGKYIHDEPPGDILLTPGNFAIGGGFKGDKFKYYDGPVPNEFVLKEGDLLVTMTDLSKRADTLGFPAFVPTRKDGRRYLHNQRLGKVLIKDKNALDARYLHYVLCGSEYRNEVFAGATGTTVKHTSPDRIKRFRFARPRIEEQRAIAHILGTLDDKIELNRRMNETVEAMARALFKSWFVDFDPVRAKMEGRWRKGESLPGLPAHLYDLFPDSFEESELGEIPMGWTCSTIGKHFKLTMGQSPPGSTYNESGHGIPFYQGRTDFGFRFPYRRVFCSAPTRLAEIGDTLVSVRAPVGDVNIAMETCAIGRGVAAVRHHSGIRSFTYYAMHALSNHFAKFEAEGTVFGSIKKSDFERLPFISPPPAMLDYFECVASPIDSLLDSNEAGSCSLAALRGALLPKLISGELRMTVSEAIRA